MIGLMTWSPHHGRAFVAQGTIILGMLCAFMGADFGILIGAVSLVFLFSVFCVEAVR